MINYCPVVLCNKYTEKSVFRNTANKKFGAELKKNKKIYIVLSAGDRKLVLSVSPYVRKVDFPALVRKNQLLARETTLTQLTFIIQRTKKFGGNVFNRTSELRLALALKYAFPHLIRNILF